MGMQSDEMFKSYSFHWRSCKNGKRGDAVMNSPIQFFVHWKSKKLLCQEKKGKYKPKKLIQKNLRYLIHLVKKECLYTYTHFFPSWNITLSLYP